MIIISGKPLGGISLSIVENHSKVKKYIDTKQSKKRNNQNSKNKTII